MKALAATLILLFGFQGADPKAPPKTLDAWLKAVAPEVRAELEKKIAQIFKAAGAKSYEELGGELDQAAGTAVREDWTPVFLSALQPRQGKEAAAILRGITAKMFIGSYRDTASARPLNALLLGEILPRSTVGDSDGKVAALEALGIVGQEQVALKDKEKGIKIEGLARSEEAARAIRAACEKAQKDPDERVRQAAAEALERIGPAK